MNRTLILDTLNKVGEEVVLSGWVQTVRSHGKIAFLDLRDRSGTIQVGGFGPDLASKFAALGQQDVVQITGKVKKREERYINKDLPTGTVEVEAAHVEVVSKAAEMPFDMGGKDLELQLPTLLDYRSLTLRHQTVSGIFQVQAAILEGFRKAAQDLEAVEIVVPTTAASSTEGGAEVFMVDYFDHKVFLTQSPQLYKQMLVPVFERVWTIAHAYRAEPSVTTRHLTETTQMDIEMGLRSFRNFSMH
jgi:nondiscriminating aspartyl-tRNA synthetase